jgi:hypothetical protein
MGQIGIPDPSEVRRNEWAAFAFLAAVVLCGLASAVLPDVLDALRSGSTLSLVLQQIQPAVNVVGLGADFAVLFGLYLAFYRIPGRTAEEE